MKLIVMPFVTFLAFLFLTIESFAAITFPRDFEGSVNLSVDSSIKSTSIGQAVRGVTINGQSFGFEVNKSRDKTNLLRQLSLLEKVNNESVFLNQVHVFARAYIGSEPPNIISAVKISGNGYSILDGGPLYSGIIFVKSKQEPIRKYAIPFSNRGVLEGENLKIFNAILGVISGERTLEKIETNGMSIKAGSELFWVIESAETKQYPHIQF